MDQLHKHHDNEERQTILNWLTSTDYGTQQSDFIARWQEGTGQWLLNSDKFKSWLNTSKQTLFCPGIPGTGKTIITALVIDYLSTSFQNDASTGIAYVYCNYKRQQEQQPVELLASLLKQLIQEQSSIPEGVKDLYKRHKDKRTRPSWNEVSKILQSVIADYSRVFLLIDALDEYQVADGGRKKLLSEIFNLQAKSELSLFATSRHIPEIEKEFEGSMSLEIRARDEDVGRYLNEHMSHLPSFVLRNADLQKEVKVQIIKAVDGMSVFFWLSEGSEAEFVLGFFSLSYT